THSNVFVRAHFSIKPSRSATSPLYAWTWLTTTIEYDGLSASTRFSRGTLSTEMPRASWTVNGNNVDAKSFSAVNTRAPSGREAATSPMSSDTVAPQATDSGLTLINLANVAP